MVFVSFNNNPTGVTSGAGTMYPSEAHESTPELGKISQWTQMEGLLTPLNVLF